MASLERDRADLARRADVGSLAGAEQVGRTTPFALPGSARGWCLVLALPAGWNSYRAKRVRPLAVEAALRLLVDRVWDGPLPSVAPTAPGGVQLEWGSGDDGVELQVGPDGSIHVLIDGHGEMQEYAARGADDPVVTDALTWADKLA